MHGVKILSKTLILAALLSMVPAAQAGSVWVRGVTAEGGWHDADKSLDKDGDLCWATTAANMVAWWQGLHPRETAAGKVPRGLAAVWQEFRNAFRDGLGSTYYCLRWWLAGERPPEQMKLAPQAQAHRGYGPAPLREQDLIMYKAPEFDGSGDISATLRGLLEKGYSVALGLRKFDAQHYVKPGGHMISLWGLDYDDATGTVTRLYVTDSDDIIGTWPQYQKGLFSADCTPVPDLKYSGGAPFRGLALSNKLKWFRGETTITTIVALHADAALPPAKQK